jgi:hypothetical protein
MDNSGRIGLQATRNTAEDASVGQRCIIHSKDGSKTGGVTREIEISALSSAIHFLPCVHVNFCRSNTMSFPSTRLFDSSYPKLILILAWMSQLPFSPYFPHFTILVKVDNRTVVSPCAANHSWTLHLPTTHSALAIPSLHFLVRRNFISRRYDLFCLCADVPYNLCT